MSIETVTVPTGIILGSKAAVRLSQQRHKYVEKALALLVASPESYNQSNFPQKDSHAGVCQTFFCFAGFLVLAKSRKLFADLCEQESTWNLWAGTAGDIIRIDARMSDDELPAPEEASTLFNHYYYWPIKFAERYRLAKTAKGRVAAAKARWIAWLKASDKSLGVK